MDENKMTWEGIDLLWIILGFIGAALGIAYMPRMEKPQLLSALIAGIMCAALVTPLVDAAYMTWVPAVVAINATHDHLPKIVNNALAFFLGIGGMFIIPGFIVFWRTGAKNPFAVIDWVRGKGSIPPVDDGQQGEPK